MHSIDISIPSFEKELNSRILYDNPQKVLTSLSYEFAENKLNSLTSFRNRNEYFIESFVKEYIGYFTDLTNHIEYIEAVRANTRRIYSYDSQGTSFNELLVQYKAQEIKKESIDFINKWLREFDIADKIEIKKIEGVANTVSLVSSTGKKALADLGYGITQFLPILLKIAMEKINTKTKGLKNTKKLILIEEPETNLHPKLQSKIADFLIDSMNKFAVSFLVETHSEYLIRKLQFLVSKKVILNDAVRIYYIYDRLKIPENKKQVQLITIDTNGRLSDSFGEGFFDEATRLALELFKNAKKKKDD